jgi:hypothetical protein
MVIVNFFFFNLASLFLTEQSYVICLIIVLAYQQEKGIKQSVRAVPEASIFWPVQEMSYEENCLTQYQAG